MFFSIYFTRNVCTEACEADSSIVQTKIHNVVQTEIYNVVQTKKSTKPTLVCTKKSNVVQTYAAGAVGAYTYMENVWKGVLLMNGMKKLFDDLRKFFTSSASLQWGLSNHIQTIHRYYYSICAHNTTQSLDMITQICTQTETDTTNSKA